MLGEGRTTAAVEHLFTIIFFLQIVNKIESSQRSDLETFRAMLDRGKDLKSKAAAAAAATASTSEPSGASGAAAASSN